MTKEVIELQELSDYFSDWLRDIEHSIDYDIFDAVMASLIKDLCDRGKIKSYTWNEKDGLTFEMKGGWKDVLSY
jgi:hypothetical protein